MFRSNLHTFLPNFTQVFMPTTRAYKRVSKTTQYSHFHPVNVSKTLRNQQQLTRNKNDRSPLQNITAYHAACSKCPLPTWTHARIFSTSLIIRPVNY